MSKSLSHVRAQFSRLWNGKVILTPESWGGNKNVWSCCVTLEPSVEVCYYRRCGTSWYLVVFNTLCFLKSFREGRTTKCVSDFQVKNKGKQSPCPCLNFSQSANFSLLVKHVNLDNPRSAHNSVSRAFSIQRKILQKPDIIKTNTSVYLHPSKNTKRDLVDGYPPDFLRFFPLPLSCFLSDTHNPATLKLLSFHAPCSFPPTTNHSHMELTFLPLSFALSLLFFFSPLSLYPHLPYSSSVSVYPVSQICITKAYHIRLVHGRGRILFWRVKGIRGEEKQNGKNSIIFGNQVREEDLGDSRVNNSCHRQIWLGTHSGVVKDSIPAYPGVCRKWNTSTKQVKARGCHAFVSLLDENLKQFLPMNMHHVYVFALISSAQQMAGWYVLRSATHYTWILYGSWGGEDQELDRSCQNAWHIVWGSGNSPLPLVPGPKAMILQHIKGSSNEWDMKRGLTISGH